MSSLLSIDENNFEEEVVSSDIPVLLEFGAPWCKPCKTLEPILVSLSEEWQGKVKVVSADVDQNMDLAMQFNIRSVPTMILFIKGQPTEQMIGLQLRQKIVEKVDLYL